LVFEPFVNSIVLEIESAVNVSFDEKCPNRVKNRDGEGRNQCRRGRDYNPGICSKLELAGMALQLAKDYIEGRED
jgi:hypothetical protein